MSNRPHVFRGLWCRCGECHRQGTSYYVSVRNDAGDTRLLAGPYPEHYEALAAVPRAKDAAAVYDTRAHWYSYGTCSVYGYTTPGVFNAQVNL